MNILLTGHRGFIGSNLLPVLSNDPSIDKIYTIDKKDGQDLLDCKLDYDVDLVIHLAGLSGVRDSIDRPNEYWKNNVMAGLRLFTTFQNRRIIYASSSTAVEPDKNPYALSKKTLEKLAPFNSLGLRFTTVYGPNARESMLIPMICNGAVKYINTNHSRDFIHVDDVCDAIKVLIEKPIKGVIDIGTGKSHKLLDIMDRFNINGFEKKIGADTERLDNKADISVLQQFEWSPKIELEGYLMKKLHPLAEMTVGDQR
tara:strand:+ start:99 stop:866 length:768 start_codon:yes stop_codon:yes gene_type:complete